MLRENKKKKKGRRSVRS